MISKQDTLQVPTLQDNNSLAQLVSSQNNSENNSVNHLHGSKPTEVSKTNPCPHCGKPDWCYSIGELTVCNRDAKPASGWEKTTKRDRNGKAYYAPATHKKPRPRGKQEYVYTDTSGNQLIKVVVIRPGKVKDKDVFQEYWGGDCWISAKKLPSDKKREYQQRVTVYRYADVQQAIAEGKTVFFVEGEGVADCLWSKGIPATTSIGGAGKYRAYGSYKADLTSANLVLCPDRDEPGLKHMEDINKDFPDAKWLYAPPSDFYWTHLPEHGGLDIKDWVQDGAKIDDINNAVCANKPEYHAYNSRIKTDDEDSRDVDSSIRNNSTFNPDNGQFGDNSGKPKKLTQAYLSALIAEQYRDKLLWNVGDKRWFYYGKLHNGLWSPVSDEFVARMVSTEARCLVGNTFNYSLISGTTAQMKADLAVDEWIEIQGLIPLRDGVLDPVTMTLLPHAPGYKFLWQLPYKWAEKVSGYKPIADWLNAATKGDNQVVQLLRAFLKAAVTGRADLQKFLELVGPGGTGKSTFLRLATSLVGKENTAITTLRQLEGNRFETAAIYGKRLVLITDSERYGGEVAVLKALTGQDDIRRERKGIQQLNGFRFDGIVMIGANEAIQSSDYTSGLKRRRCTVPFLYQVAAHLRRDLEKEFEPYLAGVLEWVLALPDSEMESLIKNTSVKVPSLNQFANENLLDTNPIAAWIDDRLVIDAVAKTKVGLIGMDESLALYPNYCKWCEGTGSKPVSIRRFSDALVDVLTHQLKYTGIAKVRDREGAHITGIVIRNHWNQSAPRPITDTYPMAVCDGLVTDCVTDCVTSQSLTSDECDECDGLNQVEEKLNLNTEFDSSKVNNEPSFEPVSQEGEKNNFKGSGDNPSHPSHPSPAMVSPVTDSSPTRHRLVTGDKVRVVKTSRVGSQFDGKKLEIVSIANGWAECLKPYDGRFASLRLDEIELVPLAESEIDF